MTKKLTILTVIVAFFATAGALHAQQKYAVIIGGNMNPDNQIIPVTEQWNFGQGRSPYYCFGDFWKETYLMWEMLVFEKEFTNANVHVLFGNGRDFAYSGQSLRFMAVSHGYLNVTDANSNRRTIATSFSDLDNTITTGDTLIVWIMSHGGTDSTGSYFYSYDNQKIYDSELASLMGNIAAQKKVVFLSFPKSAGFVPELEDEGVIVITAGGAAEGASKRDELKSKIF